ncbi:hypothetical protein Tco_1214963 [Tanacetum coccineum]
MVITSSLVCKSRPNGKLIYNFIMNGPYVRRMIPEPGDADREVPVNETFHEQINDKLTEKQLKQVEADDQAIQTILLGLPEDIYAAVDSCKTAQEIWLRVQQMMKGPDIRIQEKKAKLFNEWEMFTSTDRESIESYYQRFSKLMNDFKRNKHFLEKISNYTQLYDFLKYNQKEVDDLRAERLAKTHDPLALMANSNNPFNYPAFHQDQPSPSTYMQQPQPNNNNYNPQPSFNQNYMKQPMPNLEDITDPIAIINMALVLMAKAFKLNYSTPTNNNQRISSNPRNRPIAQPGMNMGQDRQMQMVGGNGGNQFRQYDGQNVGNQNRNGNVVATRAEGNAIRNNGNQIRCYNYRGLGHLARNCTVRPRRRDAAYLQTQLLIAQKEEAEIQLQAEEFDLMAAAANLDEIDMEQDGGTVDQHLATIEETRAYFESLYNNLAIEVEKVNSVNRKMKEINADLTTELARYKNQENCFQISQEKYDKLERCYQKSVYQEQCLTKKINALHLSSGKQITTLNEGISNLNKQLSKEKSIVSSLLEEKKKLKSDFKIHEDELLDKQIQLENKIKELDNILLKTGQSIQMIHMLSPKPNSFYHIEQKMALGYQNPFYLKQAQQKQQSLYNGKVLLEKHDLPAVYDSEETLQLAQEKAAKFVRDFKSLAKEPDERLSKHKALELEIERLLRVVASQDILCIVQSNSVIDTSNLQTKLDRKKERFENSYNDMQQKIERLQPQLRDQNGKSKDTPCVSNTIDPLSQKLDNENIELEFQVQNYEKENAHLKTTYKNLFDSISVTRAQTKTIINSLQNKLHDTIYENAKLRAQLFDKVSEQEDTAKGTSTNTKFSNQSTKRKPSLHPLRNNFVVRQPKAFQSEHTKFSKNQVPQKVDETNDLINPFKNYREEKYVPNKVRASVRTNSITVSQPHVITKKDVNCDSNGISSTGVDNTAKTRRPQPRSNTKNDRVPFAYRNLLLSKNKKHMSSECNNVKKQKANVSNTENQKKQKPKAMKPNKVGSNKRLALPKPSKPRSCLRWSPTGRLFDLKGKIIASSESESQSDCSNGYPNLFMARRLGLFQAYDRESKASHQFCLEVFGNCLGHNLFSVGQFCDSDLEVADSLVVYT